ncbi:MAG: PAS domain S-box protein [Candidatus Thorarchaeota archaeon]|nr:MAG: PAS domain S-box protein [Candidatus Thorarchaeota archaeon]
MSEKREDSPAHKVGDDVQIEVQEAMARYRAFVEIVPDAVIITDINGVFLMVNDMALELYGVSDRRELLGKNSLDFLTPESREEVIAAGEYTIEHGIGKKGYYKVIQPDGSIVTAEANSSLLRSLEGRKIGFVAVIRDVTAQFEHEAKLKKSEEKYRRLVEDSLQGVALVQDEKYTYANAAFAQTLGFTVEEILQFTPDDVWSLIHPDDVARLKERNAELADGVKVLPRHRFRYRAKDGSLKWVESFVTLAEFNGKPATQVLDIDITDQIHAEMALKESEERYRTLVSSMQELVFVFDENDNYSQYYASDESLLYVKPDRLLGKHVTHVLPDDVASLHIDAAARVRLLDHSEAFDYSLHIGGHVYWFSARMTLHEDKKSIVSVVRDITPRKEAEFALQESEERFSLFADNFPGPVFIKDEDSVILYANTFILERFDAMDWLGRNTSELFPSEIAQGMVESDRRAMSEGALEEIQVVPDKDGIDHVYQTLKFPIVREGKPMLMGGISVDISSRVATEEALRQSEERYRTLFELAPVSITITDYEGNFMAVNKEFLDSTGYTWDELRFATAKALYANPMARQGLIETLQREKRMRNVEVDLRRKDGSVFTVLLNEDTVELGGRMFILAMIRDVTELKEAEDALRESEEKYRELFQGSRDAVFIHDLEGNILDVNSSVLNLLGYSIDEMMSMKIGQLHPEYELEKSKSKFEEIAIRGEVRFEVDFLRKDGSTLPTEVSSTVLEISGKKVVQGIVRDITQRRQAEEELQKSSQLLATIYNAIPDVVISTDQSFNIVSCNRSVERVLDYTPEELIGKNYSMLIPKEFRDNPDQQRRQAELYAQGYLIQEDYQFMRKNGEVFPASFSVALIRDEKGSLSGMVGAMRDMTDRVAAEREVLVARDRAMLYLDLMTHDISNQMQVIVAGVQLAKRSDSPEEIARVLHLVEEASSRCNNIISRVVTTRQLATAPLRSVSLDSLLRVLIEDFAVLHSNVSISIEIPEFVAKVQADEFLDTMLLSILENAIQHNPRDDEKRVWVELREQNGGYLISVSDNGEGLSDTQKGWLLDMRRRYGGIGLHLARQIVEKHGGYIEVADRVEGDPSQGAKFRVWIPKID